MPPLKTSRRPRRPGRAGASKSAWRRRLPIGAELLPGGGAEFRVWAPARRRVEVVISTDGRDGDAFPLKAESEGYFRGRVDSAVAGTRYGYRLDGSERLYPDPASRFQPNGPHGVSQIIDPAAYRWNDAGWAGVTRMDPVTYEMHVATFTPDGTFAAAARELSALADLGIELIEMMPVADFPGRFGWGYDGVSLFAPTRLYGVPDDLRRFVDEAHHHGIGVILDVVYNHYGPDGNYLLEFSKDYVSRRHTSEWGETPNFDGDNAGPVREFVIANARYWIDEFHFDGLRLDATQQIFDDSPDNIMAAIARNVADAARGRATYIVAENEVQDTRLVRPPREGGFGLTAIWNDDFHHSAHVALTGRREAYYTDYKGSPSELIAGCKRGFLYQGQWYTWQKQHRGTSTRGVPIRRFVSFLENHDQVANAGLGLRLHQLSHPGVLRAMTALLLLGPQTPLLFQGQEYGAPQPFLYFADHADEKLREAVRNGRMEFLSQFPSLAVREAQRALADPGDIATFERCKLDPSQRGAGPWWTLHRDLLRIRREDPTIAEPEEVDGVVLGDQHFALRYFRADDDRLLLVNLGNDCCLSPANDPLLAPPGGGDWRIAWSSNHPRYGSDGTPRPDPANWIMSAASAILLRPAPRKPRDESRPPRRTA